MATKSASKKAAPKAAVKKAATPKKAAPKKAAAKPASAADAAAHAKDVERQVAKAEHQHQDPRGGAGTPSASAHPQIDPRHQGGLSKDRAAGRVNKVVNWFRRGKGR
ncbi:MAG: hypothetical protein QOI63_13 [Thermoplasmata archaeon]|jgi:hypothetical protein|nr:hypothetical protein [Thermoplasmata archaeon]